MLYSKEHLCSPTFNFGQMPVGHQMSLPNTSRVVAAATGGSGKVPQRPTWRSRERVIAPVKATCRGELCSAEPLHTTLEYSRHVPIAIVVLVAMLTIGPALACRATDQSSITASAEAFPELTAPVNDFALVIDQSNSQQLDAIIRSVQRETGYVIVVVTLRTCAPFSDVRDCSMKVFENQGKGIGQRGKDNGILFLLTLAEQQVRITTGYGVEHIVPDQLAHEISQTMLPAFSRGDYGDGLRQGVERVVARIREVESTR